MGARGGIAICSEDQWVFLYTHWTAGSLLSDVKDGIKRMHKVKELGLERFKKFLEHLDIEFEIIKELVNNRIVMRIRDPEVREIYHVLTDPKGRIWDLDFCIHNFQDLFLPELIIFVRERHFIHHISGFHY